MHPTACPCSVACWRTSTASIRPCAWNTPNCPPRRCTTRSSRGVATRQAKNPARTWSSAAPWTCRPSWPTTATRCPMTRPRPAPCPPGPTGATRSSAPAPIPSSWSTTRAGWTRRARRAPAARCCRCCRRPTGRWPAPCRPMTSAPAPSATWPPPRTRAWTAWRRRCWRRWARTTRRCTPRRTTRWTCWNAATPRWPTTCWSPIPATASNAAPRWPSSTRATTR